MVSHMKLHMVSHMKLSQQQPRIRLKTLQLFKIRGVINVPNFKHYYWAAQIKPLLTWLQSDIHTCWLNIENSKYPEPMETLPFLDSPVK